MKRILFYAYTPFQVIASLAIKLEYYPDDIADIILPESVQSRENLKKNIISHGLFDIVYYANVRAYFPKKGNRAIHEINRIKSAFCPYYLSEDIGIKKKYDVFITTEIDYYTESIFSRLRKCNKQIEVELMDEGYSSYTYYFREAYKPSTKKNIVKSLLFKLPGMLYRREFIAKKAHSIYYFAPELLCWKDIPYTIKKIDVKSNKLFLEKLNQLFDYERLKKSGLEKEYNRRFLYFEESFFWSKGNNNDVEIINRISELVGKEEMAIKLHPRNEINRFEKGGYKTNKTPGIPWELIAVNLDDSDQRVFLSFSSGAVLNYKFLSNKNFKTILLYKCIGDEYYKVDSSVKMWFDRFEKEYGDSVYVPETMDDLEKILVGLDQ